MPAFSASPFATLPEVAIPGKPAYLFGSLPVTTADMVMTIASVAITSNVATVIGTIQAGNIPAVGNLISIQGTTTASGTFNVTGVALASVSVTGAGVATLTFALTHANVATTPDAGKGMVPIQEVAETLANGASVPVFVPSQEPVDNGLKAIVTSVTFPTLPTAVAVILQSALYFNSPNSEWTQVGSANAATVAASAQTLGPLQTFNVAGGRFFRFNVSGLSGSGTIIAKLVP